MTYPNITFKESAKYYSRLQRNRYLSKTYSTVLIVEGLRDSVTSEDVLSIFDSLKEGAQSTVWIYREHSDLAYVCCKTPQDADFIQTAMNNCNLNDYDRNKTLGVSVELQVTFAPLFIEKRFLDLVFKILNPLPKLTSTYMKIVASVKLCSTDWLSLVPTAYNVVKTVDQTKVLIEFRSLQEAKAAFERINGACLMVESYKNGCVPLLLACQFVTKQYFKTKVRFCNKRLNDLFEAEDKLMTSVVEWLYT